MKAKGVLIKALRRAKGERGLRTAKPNVHMSDGHIKKADHNLVVMTDLSSLGHEDWVVIAAYYAMYQSALAILAKIGLESKEHATTASVLEYFFGEHIGRELIEKFNEMKVQKDRIEAITIKEEYIDNLWKAKWARETVQYGISVTYKETDVVMKNAREFVSKIKLVASQLDEEIVRVIGKEISDLKEMVLKRGFSE
ncbi:MAG: HEPN domain-containing protein [Candidatus Aenigmarchaeota archaeon]|nr:HEPN domain-containing protein [Candidatus Aenigmarchaeota archaeon]